MMQDVYEKAKQRAVNENKTLFLSNTELLKNNISDFDKVINIPDDVFIDRVKTSRPNAKYDIKEWKNQINEVFKNVPENKVITTSGYLSDLLPESTKTSDQTETTEEIRKAQEKDVSSQKDEKIDDDWASLAPVREQQIPITTTVKFGDLTKQVENKCK